MHTEENSIIYKKSFDFALQIINLYKQLTSNREFIMSKQLLKSSTSIGANISESFYAQSTNDYISKLSIALKEANETKYWLNLLIASNYISQNYGNPLLDKILEIIKILSKIIKTTKTIKN